MAADRWDQIDELFAAALPLGLADRAAFLEERCGQDTKLLRRLQQLLENDSRAGPEFLERPAIAGLRWGRSTTYELPAGQRVGAYTILGLIAGGGMGTVYLAEQEKPRRRVALKILHAGLGAPAVVRRFEFESQILARLQHPNIAHVYEAGVFSAPPPSCEEPGRDRPAELPYFAMEHVPSARTITDYAREQALGACDRLELFLQVCDAVAYAHGKGVIHRDLKPGNILVSDEATEQPSGEGASKRTSRLTGVKSGAVKVIDFGVARAVDSDVAVTTMHTGSGRLVGTLAYMSPEQCDADPLGLDIRSDVYSLGLVLYELLCGTLPYEVSNTSVFEAMKTIREQAPAPPSRVRPAGAGLQPVRGDLERVVLKALEKDRAKRYASVAELAADVRRYMNREPVSARPPTAWVRARRWAVRHPVTLTALACLSMAAGIAAGTLVSVWWMAYDPYAIVLDGAGEAGWDAARMVTRMGRTLHTWPTKVIPGKPCITFAELVDRPGALGDGRMAILGFLNELHADNPGAVCAYEIQGTRAKLLWESRLHDTDIPTEYRQERRAGDLGSPAGRGIHLLADLFTDVPGEELVAVFSRGPWSQRALRILDLNGRVLYQVWQDGGIDGLYWMSEVRLLVCVGRDEQVKELANRQAPSTACPDGPVMFALRPQRDLVSSEFFRKAPGDSSLSAAWYRYMHPLASEANRYQVSIVGRYPPSDPEEAVRIRVDVCAAGANEPREHQSFSMLINASGDEIPQGRVVGDEYRRLVGQGSLLPAKVFQLSEIPPR